MAAFGEAAAAPKKSGEAGLLGELLHALNQPLTGLQCSLEVALAVERTEEEYRRFLCEGLELTERMRALVEALREVAELERTEESGRESIEVAGVLREVMEDLRPVAEANQVRLAGNWASAGAAAAVGVGLSRSGMTSLIFRVLDAVLSLAAQGSEMEVTLSPGLTADQIVVGIAWSGAEAGGEYSRPRLGLRMAQARLERSGGRWSQLNAGGRETITLVLPVPAEGAG